MEPIERNSHKDAKYLGSIINTSEDISQVKVFVTDARQTDKWV